MSSSQHEGEFIGFVSEFDILRALEAKKDLNQLIAGDIKAKDRIAVTDDTGIEEAVKLMEEKRLSTCRSRRTAKSPIR